MGFLLIASMLQQLTYSIPHRYNELPGAGLMVLWLKVLAVLPEDLALVPSIYMVAYNHP